MRMLGSGLARASATLALFVFAARGHAGPLADVLKARQAKLDALFAKSSGELGPEQKEALGKALAEAIDFKTMGQGALAERWEGMTAAQKSAYLAAFEELVRANFLRKVEVYRADSVEYLDEKVDGKSGSARTSIRSKSATTEVVYAFSEIDGRWRIVDYTIDGVSAVKNYRSQFAKIADKRGIDGLIERLKKRKGEIEAGS